MTEEVPRLPADQIQLITLNQIKQAAERTAAGVGEPTKGEIFSTSPTITTKGISSQEGKDLFPDGKAWKSLSLFNNGPDVITVELYTWDTITDKVTKKPKMVKIWQDAVTVRVSFELKVEYKEDRIIAIRPAANATTAVVDINLAR